MRRNRCRPTLALALLATVSAAPALSQVVIREHVEVRAEPLPTVIDAALSAGDEWTFEVGGDLRLRVGPLPDRYGGGRTTTSRQCGSPSAATFTFTISGADGAREVVVPIGALAAVSNSYPTCAPGTAIGPTPRSAQACSRSAGSRPTKRST